MSLENHPSSIPWSIAHDPLTVDIVEYRRVSGKKVQFDEPLHDKLTAMISHHFDGQQQQNIIQSREIQKPVWFIEAESNARSFMASLGFDELGEVYLIEGHLNVRDLDVNAYHDSITRKILASHARLTHMLHTEGIATVTSALVHELTHDTAPHPQRITLQQHADNTSRYEQRNGWITSGKHADQGIILEEGFCEYVAGLYRRQSTEQKCDLLPAEYTPTADLPPHLQTDAVIAGSDAHILELMAWGLEQQGIISSNAFISLWFDARKTATYASATHEIIKAINSLAPGLYSYLKKLEYSKENWISARDTVYKIITS